VLEGDRIVEFNGLPCSTLMFESLHEMFTQEGAPFTLKGERDGKKIGNQPSNPAASVTPALLVRHTKGAH
jgi:hypothetical protein